MERYHISSILAQSMLQPIKALLCSLSCIILLMPQGWCCWLVSLNCCSAPEASPSSCCKPVEKTECCCCSATSESLPCRESDSSLPVNCIKCSYEAIRPALEKPFDIYDYPTALLPFTWQFTFSEVQLEPRARVHGPSPPLHVQLCIWRC